MDAKIEIERKYIIKMPSLKEMQSMEDYTESKITQIYLESARGVTHRVRSRVYGGQAVYTETKKTRIDEMSVYEDEREISESEFAEKSKNIDKSTRPIFKTRYTFSYKGATFEIDAYPEWKKHAIMETELNSRTEEVVMPPFISIVREVSGEKPYSNSSMSNSFPKELITCDNASRELS